MAMRPLGALDSVDPREAWDNEAHDFTPWLADNLGHLATAIGIELEREGTEMHVGPLRADIVARNPRDDSRVLIENQLEHADLHHLGQVLAYLAGLEAKTVVWVAKGFDEAHLSALRWLNESEGPRGFHHGEDRGGSDVPAHGARRVPACREYVDEVVDPAAQGRRPDLLADAGANRKRFKHGLLLGPWCWGPAEDHAYYVKRVAAPMPATPEATVPR